MQLNGSVMKISYLDGPKIYCAVLVRSYEVIKDQKYLDKINIFPVPDSDTGTNRASIMRSITERAVPDSYAYKALHSITDIIGVHNGIGTVEISLMFGS